MANQDLEKLKVQAFRMLSIRGKLRLESKGLRNLGGATRPKIAAEFGLKPRDSFEKFIAVAQERIDKLTIELQQAVADENP